MVRNHWPYPRYSDIRPGPKDLRDAGDWAGCPCEILHEIRVGFEMTYEFFARTPVVLMLNVHPSRAPDIIEPDQLRTTPTLPLMRYLDEFGNVCTRLVAPAGELTI